MALRNFPKGAVIIKGNDYGQTSVVSPIGVPADDPAAAPEGDGISLGRRFLNLRTGISFAAAFAIMAFAFSRINVDPADVIRHIRGANIGLYVLALVVYYLSFPLRAWRWQLILANVGYRRDAQQSMPSVVGLGEIIFLSWFANCLVPAKLGDAYRGYLLKRAAGVSFSRTMGTVLAERIIDMLVLFVLMSVAALRVFGAHLPDIVEQVLIAGAILAFLVVLAIVAMKRFGRVVERMLPSRVRGVYGRFEEGTLQSFRNLPLLFVLTVLVWVIEGARLWLILAALGLTNVGMLPVIFISLAASLLTTLPVTPAGLGLVEGSIAGILILLNSLGSVQGVSESLAASAALLDRTISYWSLVVFGCVLYIFTKKK